MGRNIPIFLVFFVAFLWPFLGWCKQADAANTVEDTLIASSDTLQSPPALNKKPADETLDSELVRAGRNTLLLSMLFLMLSFLALGITIAVAGPFVLFAFATWGIISTSVIVELYRRSLSKGFRKLLVLIGSIIGTLVSIVGWLILVWRFSLSHAGIIALMLAAGVGLLTGISLGFITCQIAIWLLDSFKRQLFKSND